MIQYGYIGTNHGMYITEFIGQPVITQTLGIATIFNNPTDAHNALISFPQIKVTLVKLTLI